MTTLTFHQATKEDFAANLRGELIAPADPGYDEARTIPRQSEHQARHLTSAMRAGLRLLFA